MKLAIKISKKVLILLVAFALIGVSVLELFPINPRQTQNVPSDSSLLASIDDGIEPANIGPTVAPLHHDNEIINFPFTDDLSHESLIIKSDRKYYNGFSDSNAYFSITNTSNLDEDAILLFYFPGQFIPNRDDPSGVQPATIASVEQRHDNQWQKLNFFSKNININYDQLSSAVAQRKPIPADFEIKAGTQIKIAAGQTAYFRSNIKFPPGSKGEFWIETLGNNGGYGLLDPWYNSSWSYRKSFTINHLRVSGGIDLTDFPTEFSFSDQNIKTTGFGGKAASGSGEFVFTSADGTTVLSHEIEKYSSSSGQFIGWVKIPTLSVTQDTIVYMYYGGPSSGATNQNKTGTWNANYKAVWHLADNSASTAVKDSTTNAANGTLTANSNTKTGTGLIGGSGFVMTSTDGINIPTFTIATATSPITFSAWIKTSATDAAIFGMRGSLDNSLVDFVLGLDGVDNTGTGRPAIIVRDDAGAGLTHIHSATAINNNAAHYVVATRDSSKNLVIYVDGVSKATGTDTMSGVVTLNNARLGDEAVNATIPNFVGTLDEMRISYTNHSAGWTTTEYNNQSQPLKFMAPSGEGVSIRSTPDVKYGTTISTDTHPGWYASGGTTWGYRRRLTINHFKVSGGSDLTDFPALVNFTDNTVKTTGFGGKAASGSGEFVFTSADGTTVLSHEIEKYSSSSGQFIGWVKIPTLSVTQDTIVYMYYGGPSSGATNQNKTGTWDSAYKGVWHLPNGTTLTAKDSTTNANNGTVTSATAATGQVDGAANFNATSGNILATAAASINNLGATTLSAWVYPKSIGEGGVAKILSKNSNAGAGAWQFFVDDGSAACSGSSNGIYVWAKNNTIGNSYSIGCSANGALVFNTWTHVVTVWDGSSITSSIYVNGILSSGSPTGQTGSVGDDSALNLYIGNTIADDRTFDGYLDEIKISNSARTAGWIATEYFNQSQPARFYSLGGLEALTPVAPGAKIQ